MNYIFENEIQDNPWERPFTQIVWGFVLSFISFNFAWLQYILPTFGVIMIIVGFRTLQRENKYFEIAWMLSIANGIYYAGHCFFLSTPLSLNAYANIIGGLIKIVLQVAIFIQFGAATKQVCKEYETKPHGNPFLVSVFLLIAINIVAFTPYAKSSIIVLFLLIGYAINMWSMFKISNKLYVVKPNLSVREPKIKDGVLVWCYAILCIVLVIMAGIYSNHLIGDPVIRQVNSKQEVRKELVVLGFPEKILSDLSEENVEELKGAIHVETSTEQLVFEYDRCLTATTVYTELPDNLLFVLVHFQWDIGKAIWNDGFSICGEDNYELIDGRLLWNRAKLEYTCPIKRLTNKQKVTQTMFFGEQQSRQITGTICFPHKSVNQRGYIFYKMKLSEYRLRGGTCLNYVHFLTPFRLPFVYPEQQIQNGHDNVRQQYTNFELWSREERQP